MARYLVAWLQGCGACGREFREAEVKIRVHSDRDEAAAVNAAGEALRAMADAEGWFLPTNIDLSDETETRCPDCNRARRASEPTTVYLMQSERRWALKVGIAGTTSTRLQSHRRRGWRLAEVNGRRCLWVLRRTDARVVERAIIERWRRAGVPMANACIVSAENGYTETASLTVDADLLKTTVGWLDELAQGRLLDQA
ncbi:hypothetical protein [Nocardia sp. BMG111209]|uniref:hypothetical protein n=1 Tax=Nocardia sp. BMG111209 TaxID=1160137 RepID=UPI0012DD5501|nr:hypothetical protein [Nocardia sp. BMG111209]